MIKEQLLAETKASHILETTHLDRSSGNRAFETFAQTLTGEWSADKRAIVWLSHDSHWVFPHDFRLWKALEVGRHLRLPVLVIARYIAPPTFVLLKALGVHGVQYYSSIVADDHEISLRRDAQAAGWFHVRGATSLSTHPVRVQIANGLTRLGAMTRSPQVDEALSMASQKRMGDPASTLSDLLDWAATTEVGLPSRWIETIESWRAWQTGYQGPVVPAMPKADFGRETQVTRIGIRV